MVWDGVSHRPFPSEGGHCSFSPNDEIGDELLSFMRKQYGHVSWERVLSGMGIKNLYNFFRQRSGQPEPEWLKAELAKAKAVGASASRMRARAGPSLNGSRGCAA